MKVCYYGVGFNAHTTVHGGVCLMLCATRLLLKSKAAVIYNSKVEIPFSFFPFDPSPTFLTLMICILMALHTFGAFSAFLDLDALSPSSRGPHRANLTWIKHKKVCF